MPAGRPTEITQELIDKASVFVTVRSIMSVHELLPTIEGLALDLHINRDTIYDWESKGDATEDKDSLLARFSDIVKELRWAQAEKLIQNSLRANYNPMMAKLMLSKHGYVEKSEQDITSKGEQINQAPDETILSQYMMRLKDDTKQ
jgi:hypothetical protein